MLSAFSLKSPVILKEQHFYRLVVLYRWFALIVPTMALFFLMDTPQIGLALFLYGLAWANNIIQNMFYLHYQAAHGNGGQRQQSYQDAGPFKNHLLLLISLEVFICIVLNAAGGVWTSTYYLYALAPIFQSTLFFGLRGALTSALALSLSYAASIAINVVLTGIPGHNWLLPVAYLTCYVLSASLFGYQAVISNQLRRHAATIERYRVDLESQNLSLGQANQRLEQANQRLEYLSRFSQVLQDGTTLAEVENLAVEYLNRHTYSCIGSDNVQPGSALPSPAQIIKPTETFPEWLSGTATAFNSRTDTGQPDIRLVTTSTSANQLAYWIAPLTFKGNDQGWLVLPATASLNQADLGGERLLAALLANQLARALGSLKQSQELAIASERTRLAVDMHDVVAQSLYGIAVNLETCSKLFERDPQAAREQLAYLENLVFDTLSSVRAIIYDLWDEKIGENEFTTLIGTYIKKIGRLYPFKIILEIQEQPSALNGQPIAAYNLDRDSQKGLYRLIQEALANAAKHSYASEVRIKLSQYKNEVRVEVLDNGGGFEMPSTAIASLPAGHRAALALSGGLGLVAMRERVEGLGGRLKVESVAGQGVLVAATLPSRP